MFLTAWHIAVKDCRLVLVRGGGLVQSLLLGLLLIFVFSLSRQTGEAVSPQTAAAIFWLASAFCQVLAFNMVYALEETHEARAGLLLMPNPVQAVWLGKGLAGLILLLLAQCVFLPAILVFLTQEIGIRWGYGLAALLLVDIGMATLGSLLGALSQGQAARESLLSIILFPLLVPVLLAGIRMGTGVFADELPDDVFAWLKLALAFDGIFLAAGLLLFPFVFNDE